MQSNNGELKKEKLSKAEKYQLYANIIGPIMIVFVMGWLAWSFKAEMSLLFSEEDKKNAETYVPKTWFEKSHEETNKKLDDLSEKENVMSEDVATIKGELSVKTK